MHDAHPAEVQPHRNRGEPLQVVLLVGSSDLIQERLVLLGVLGRLRVARVIVGAQVLAAAERPFGVIGDGVELVIAHDDKGTAGVDHRLDDLEHA